MIVDAHAHWGPWFFSLESGRLGLNSAQLDAYGIERQLLSAVEAVVYDAPLGNARLAEQLAATDDTRFRGYVTVDPRRLAEAERDLGRYRPPLWVGVKIHTSYHTTPVTSDRMRAAVALATQAGLPCLIHTWGPDVVDLADLAERVDGARLVAGHMGAYAWRLVPEARRRSDRVWFEPCWSMPDAGRVRWVLDEMGPDRLLFGTDATLIHPAVTLGAIAAAHLTPTEQAAVMGGNAQTLFDLT